MFKRFIGAFIAVSMIASPVIAKGGGFSSGSSFGGRSSSFSSGSSFRSSSYSSSYSRPAATAPKFTSGSSYAYKPTQSRVVSRPSYSSYNTPAVQNHYYGNSGGMGGGFGSSFLGSFGGSMIGNMMFGNHQQSAPVYINNGQPVQQEAPAQIIQQDTGPGFFGMIFWGLVNFLVLIGVIALLIWGGRKIYLYFRK